MGKQIRWGILQPLTGGMYFGTKQATGCDAQWIISFNGLNSPKFDKEGNLIDGGNEYHLTTYLKKHDCMPPYYIFKDRKMFQADIDANPELITEDGQRREDIEFLSPVWMSYSYLHPDVYLTKEAAKNHLPADLHCENIHTRYYVFEQDVIVN